jgi:hypothetical protein
MVSVSAVNAIINKAENPSKNIEVTQEVYKTLEVY